MANAKDLSRKISSLQNMQKVTRAMNMIASIKLRKLFSVEAPLAGFSKALDRIIGEIRECVGGESHPALAGYSEKELENVVVFTADKGLCGAHNNSVNKQLAVHIEELKHRGIASEVSSFGLKGSNFCRRKGYELFHQAEINDRSLSLKDLRRMASKLYRRYMSGRIQGVSVVYNKFHNTLQQETVVQQVLPILGRKDPRKYENQAHIEPEPELFIDSAAELYLYYMLSTALYNSYLSEHASRMTAMENATHNSDDLISRYVTLQNRARQTTITNEIIEIVSGKEAMKG